MTTTNQLLTIWQGEDKVVTVELVDANGEAYGSTATLDFLYRVTTAATDRSAILEKTTGGGITNGTGSITIELDKVDTDDLDEADYYHELRVIDLDGNEDVVFEGIFRVEASATL